MRRFAFLLTIGAVVACAEREPETADTTAMGDTAMAAGMPAPAPTPISLENVAGRWNVTTRAPGDTAPLNVVLVATNTRQGWQLRFPTGAPVPVRVVSVAGDSIITEAGPFMSRRRPGVQVRSRTVYRLQDGRLVQTTEARYARGPDTLVVITGEGTRVP